MKISARVLPASRTSNARVRERDAVLKGQWSLSAPDWSKPPHTIAWAGSASLSPPEPPMHRQSVASCRRSVALGRPHGSADLRRTGSSHGVIFVFNDRDLLPNLVAQVGRNLLEFGDRANHDTVARTLRVERRDLGRQGQHF